MPATLSRWWRHLTHGWPRSNCLFFAVALYIARGKGRITFRRARNSILPHFMYCERRGSRDRLVHYVPVSGGDSESAPLFSGVVIWGDRALNQHLAATVANMRAWARATTDNKALFCVPTKYGVLAFFKDQIDSTRGDHQLEALLMVRIDLAREDQEARGVVPKH